jgi:hypothetical protein
MNWGLDYGSDVDFVEIYNNINDKMRSAERHLGDQGAVGRDGVGEIGMFVRVDMILPAGEHRDRSGREAAAVGGCVNAAREA